MRLLVLASALPHIVAFATVLDERMTYSSMAACPPGTIACEGITVGGSSTRPLLTTAASQLTTQTPALITMSARTPERLTAPLG